MKYKKKSGAGRKAKYSKKERKEESCWMINGLHFSWHLFGHGSATGPHPIFLLLKLYSINCLKFGHWMFHSPCGTGVYRNRVISCPGCKQDFLQLFKAAVYFPRKRYINCKRQTWKSSWFKELPKGAGWMPRNTEASLYMKLHPDLYR